MSVKNARGDSFCVSLYLSCYPDEGWQLKRNKLSRRNECAAILYVNSTYLSSHKTDTSDWASLYKIIFEYL